MHSLSRCTGATAIDALSAGYRTILIDDCCRGVDLNDIESTKQTVISSNGVIVSSREVGNEPLRGEGRIDWKKGN